VVLATGDPRGVETSADYDAFLSRCKTAAASPPRP
jgi:hypothetical protein